MGANLLGCETSSYPSEVFKFREGVAKIKLEFYTISLSKIIPPVAQINITNKKWLLQAGFQLV